ncbi:MAG: TldD/PmbA family protein [Phycisphaerales bacterium]|jgi:predicted Zn-dependent protease|nr:TldD/PmbA family protein [Phycisphaerales bacterium]
MPSGVDYCSVRYLAERDEAVAVRQDKPLPVSRSETTGVMITVIADGALGYAATCDLGEAGLAEAAGRAVWWAKQAAGRAVTDFSKIAWPSEQAEVTGPNIRPWSEVSLEARYDLLTQQCARLKTDDRIVDWSAGIWFASSDSLLLTSDGGRIHQTRHYTMPSMNVTANHGAETQTRSLGGHSFCQQGGMEVLDTFAFTSAAPRLASEAIELLTAPNCPTGSMDLILAPDQMVLQIHESIGHPLELDRILGDERNYAGTSFVTTDMLGTYQYGSEKLNITYDPSRPEQLASYSHDDEGAASEKAWIIKDGLLLRSLGGTISQARTGLDGVANSRACSWNRPAIDRMANLNLEPGDMPFNDMVSSIQRGVYMETNCSWSIDDSRNKFQFGCERGRLIEDGKLTSVVKNCNYRGISATFWRSLKGVGPADETVVMGTPNCGKGEPNQVIRVAHASGPAMFENVDVFGGAEA